MATIRVKAKPATGFRRAGMKFTPEFSEPFEVSKQALEQLKAEPELIVEDLASGSNSDPDLSAQELIVKIGEMTEASEIGKLLKNEKRVTVIDAAKARIKELKTAK
jgi:hypothetical protein